MQRLEHETPLLRILGLSTSIAVPAGALGSFGLMLHRGRNAPRLLIVLFSFWVLSPFVLLALAQRASKRWSIPTREILYAAALVVAIGSLAIYAADAWRPPKAQPAFWYVLIPPMSWLVIAAAFGVAGLMSRRRSRDLDGV